MNIAREDIIRMAIEAGLSEELWLTDDTDLPLVTRFAALVAAAEREACAELCDMEATIEGIAQKCAAAIRARGETK